MLEFNSEKLFLCLLLLPPVCMVCNLKWNPMRLVVLLLYWFFPPLSSWLEPGTKSSRTNMHVLLPRPNGLYLHFTPQSCFQHADLSSTNTNIFCRKKSSFQSNFRPMLKFCLVKHDLETMTVIVKWTKVMVLVFWFPCTWHFAWCVFIQPGILLKADRLSSML